MPFLQGFRNSTFLAITGLDEALHTLLARWHPIVGALATNASRLALFANAQTLIARARTYFANTLSLLVQGANKQREGVVREWVLGELSSGGGSKGLEEGFHGSAGGSRVAFLPCEGGVTGFPASLGVSE